MSVTFGIFHKITSIRVREFFLFQASGNEELSAEDCQQFC